MNLENRTVWQHAAGDRAHDHRKICFDWDVILSGGPDQLKKEMKSGDIVVLKLGVTTLLAIGIVGEYQQCAEFDDIDGWSLKYTRRVRWIWKAKNPEELPKYSFKYGTATQRLHKDTVIERVKAELARIDDSVGWENIKRFDFPSDLELDAEEIASFLFEKGLPSDSIRNLLDRRGSFTHMASWYSRDWKTASEQETVCHLVVPLLRVLGWTPQKICLQFNRVDAALFARLPRRKENLAVVVEVKKVHGACLSAISQARNYATQYKNCSRIIVTDGLRYGVYIRDGTEWPEDPKPYAYVNVNRPRSAYPIYGDLRGAKEAIYAMTPDYTPEP